MDTQHLTINEYSQQFKVSPNTIRRHINNKKPSDTEIREWLEGNICRCTGYQNIVAAVKEAASKM